MKVLITGAAGFIGTNLCKTLINLYKDIEIIGLDNYNSGSKENHIETVKYIEGNTWDILKIEDLKNFKPKYIFHFGEYSRIVQSFEEPTKTFFSNTIGTQQVLEYAVKNDSKLIYSGSSAIFGNDMKDQHLNPYAWTKCKNIELIHNYKDWYNLNFAICYFYNVYGPKQICKGNYATVIGIFEDQYVNNKPLTVVSPGTQSRCFTHIDDIIEGIIMVAKNGNGDHYYLGNEKSYSIIDIAKMFNSNYILIHKRRGERESSKLIISDNIQNLGWKAKIEIEDYINNFKNKK
jgi:UDP-glucose 4-epimerase